LFGMYANTACPQHENDPSRGAGSRPPLKPSRESAWWSAFAPAFPPLTSRPPDFDVIVVGPDGRLTGRLFRSYKLVVSGKGELKYLCNTC